MYAHMYTGIYSVYDMTLSVHVQRKAVEGSLGSWTCWEMRWLCRAGRTSEVDWTSRVSPTYLAHHCILLQGHTPFIFNTSLEAFSIWSLHMYKGIIYEALCSAMPFSVCATYPASVVCMLLPASEMCVCLLYCREHNRSHECVHGV